MTSTDKRDWNKQPVNFFDASPTQRRLYTQAYNELQKKFPNTVLPIDVIRQRMQEIEDENSPLPPSIWIDSGDLANAFARGYANYFLSPYNSGMPEEGPSDGKSIEYVRRIIVLREAAGLVCRYCREAEKYGPVTLDADHALFAHTLHSAVWCEAQPIQEAISKCGSDAALAAAQETK